MTSRYFAFVSIWATSAFVNHLYSTGNSFSVLAKYPDLTLRWSELCMISHLRRWRFSSVIGIMPILASVKFSTKRCLQKGA